jgi:hypothetical protein
MPGLIQQNNNDDSSEGDESEEDEETSVPVALEEYIIGGEDQAARLPGERMEPPRGRAREEYMIQQRGHQEFVGVYLLYWMDRAWDIFQQYRRSELQQQCDLLYKKTTSTTLAGVDLSYLYRELIKHPHIVASGGNKLVQMVIANAERRNTSNSNFANFGQTERLLLDSASTIHTARNKRGMTNLQGCNKAVDSADRGRLYVKEMGTRKFIALDKEGEPMDFIVCMEDTHVLEGFMNDLVRLPLLLRKGCLVIKCTTDLIRIQLPGTQYRGKHMDFKRADDGLFYMEVIPLPDTAEQANSSHVVSDDDDESDEDLDDDPDDRLDDDSDDNSDSDNDDHYD